MGTSLAKTKGFLYIHRCAHVVALLQSSPFADEPKSEHLMFSIDLRTNQSIISILVELEFSAFIFTRHNLCHFNGEYQRNREKSVQTVFFLCGIQLYRKMFI